MVLSLPNGGGFKQLNFSGKPSPSVFFEIVSSTFLHFFPYLSPEEHEILFNKILTFQELDMLCQNENIAFLHKIKVELNELEKLEFLKTNASIICTLHMGAHRLICQILAKYQIPFSILISSAAFKEFETQINHKNFEMGSAIQLLNADSPSVIFQMIRSLKKGMSILCYLDGQSGLTKSSNMTKIHFLGREIYSKSGIVYLAQKSKSPILPILSYYPNENEISFQLFNPIFFDSNTISNSTEIIQNIYDGFSFYILKYPGQWQGWLNLHRSVIIDKAVDIISYGNNVRSEDSTYEFNHKYYGLFFNDNDHFILRKTDLMAFRIPEPLYHLLKSNQKRIVKTEISDLNLFTELLANKVLQPT